MTTPRVTVPVEPTERLAQYVKGTSPYRAWRGVPPEGEPTLKSDIAAMLSAAPAPEGGAVPKSILAVVDHFEMARAQDLAFSISRYCNGPLNVSVGDLRALVAIAPAEAGELIDHLEAYRPHLADEGVGSIYVSMTLPQLDALLSALRAQPPAREDAQPVAWRMIGRDGSTISLQAEPYHGGFAHMMASDVGCTVEPLYTHPAPDALRAIEMLRASEGDSVTILCDNPEATDLDDAMAVVCCGPWTDWKDRRFYGRDVSDALSKALAAQQAEQGAK